MSLELYHKVLDLFSTMNEAIDYIKNKTRKGDFSVCLTLLDDTRIAADEILNSGIILVTRINQVLKTQASLDCENKYLEFTTHLGRLERVYGDNEVNVMVSIIE